MARSRIPGRSLDQRAKDAERRAHVLELFRQDLPADEIAKRCGYSHRKQVYRVLKAAFRDIWVEHAEEASKVQMARLNAMFSGLAKNGAFDGDPTAVQAAVKIIERQCKIQGLDAPERKELTGKDGAPLLDVAAMTDEQLRAIVAGIVPSKPRPDGDGGTGAPAAPAGSGPDASGAARDPAVEGAEASAGDRGAD